MPFFLQGKPFDHSPKILSKLNQYINNKELNIDFEFVTKRIIESNIYRQSKRYNVCRNIKNTWFRIFGENPDGKQEIHFGPGAQFIVSKKRILKRPKEFYENIVNILAYDICPDEGYDIERFHKYIFA